MLCYSRKLYSQTCPAAHQSRRMEFCTAAGFCFIVIYRYNFGDLQVELSKKKRGKESNQNAGFVEMHSGSVSADTQPRKIEKQTPT